MVHASRTAKSGMLSRTGLNYRKQAMVRTMPTALFPQRPPCFLTPNRVTPNPSPTTPAERGIPH